MERPLKTILTTSVDGRRFRIHEYPDYRPARSRGNLHGVVRGSRFETSDGELVKRHGKSAFLIVDSGLIVTPVESDGDTEVADDEEECGK